MEDPLELDDLLAHTVEKIVGKASPKIIAMIRKSILAQLGTSYSWPGNVRELGQCVRRILLKRSCAVPASGPCGPGGPSTLDIRGNHGFLSAQDILKSYCRMMYDHFETLGEVARITGLDRRTVKKYIQRNTFPPD
jgi:hypothetical protein